MSVCIPTEIQHSLERFKIDHPEGSRVCFIMMQFGETPAHTRIADAIKKALSAGGLIGVRADDKDYHSDLFPNVLTYIYGCDFGVAVYERIEDETFNPNVSLETGYMLALGKPVCLLKDKTLPKLQPDLVGKLYKSFDTREPGKTIPKVLAKWLDDHSDMIASCPANLAGGTCRVEVGFCEVQDATGYHTEVRVRNVGNVALNIRRVELTWLGGYRWMLAPNHPGVLLPRKPINMHEHSRPWEHGFRFVGPSADATRTLIGRAAETALAGLTLEVWADEDPERPVWSRSGEDLAELHRLIRDRWDHIVASHPVYIGLRELLHLSEAPEFRNIADLSALVQKHGFDKGLDDLIPDEDGYLSCATRRRRRNVEIFIAKSLFDDDGNLISMMRDEWRDELIRIEEDRRQSYAGDEGPDEYVIGDSY